MINRRHDEHAPSLARQSPEKSHEFTRLLLVKVDMSVD
jgi:hypothetical protein